VVVARTQVFVEILILKHVLLFFSPNHHVYPQQSAVGGSYMCTAHGGGRRCQFQDCTRSAQSSTNFCVRHGGGRKCQIEGCQKVCGSGGD